MKFSRPATMLAAGSVGLSLALAGCSTPAAEPGDEDTTITYWSWDGAPGGELVEPAIEAFEEANPGITVEYTETPANDYKAKAALALSSGEDIDVLTVQPGTWAQEVEDYLVPVEEWANGADLVGKFTEASVEQTARLFTDEQLLAVPLYLTGSAIGIYNADILEAVGVEPPTTWAEFKVLSDALKAQGEGILPAVMPGDPWFQDEVALTLVGQLDPDFFNNVRYNDGNWDTPEYVQALKNYKALYDDGTLDKATLDLDYGGATGAFDEGKAAVLFNGSWETSRILNGNFGIVPFPAENAEDASLRSFLDVTLGITSQSEEQEAAAEFVEFMSAGEGVEFWASVLRGIPAVDGYELPEGVLTTDLQKESYAKILELLLNPRSDRNNMGAFSDAVGANVKSAVLGQITPEEAAADDQKQLEAGNF